LGFVNVLDAFHVVGRGQIDTRFFDVNDGTPKSLTLTDHLLALASESQGRNLPAETEARWRLVETAWQLDITPSLLNVDFDAGSEHLFVVRDAGVLT
jgi:hypothetical protein